MAIQIPCSTHIKAYRLQPRTSSQYSARMLSQALLWQVILRGLAPSQEMCSVSTVAKVQTWIKSDYARNLTRVRSHMVSNLPLVTEKMNLTRWATWTSIARLNNTVFKANHFMRISTLRMPTSLMLKGSTLILIRATFQSARALDVTFRNTKEVANKTWINNLWLGIAPTIKIYSTRIIRQVKSSVEQTRTKHTRSTRPRTCSRVLWMHVETYSVLFNFHHSGTRAKHKQSSSSNSILVETKGSTVRQRARSRSRIKDLRWV